jgi:hypothetical protein
MYVYTHTQVRKGSYEGDCRVWYRPVADSPVHSLRVTADIDAPLGVYHKEREGGRERGREGGGRREGRREGGREKEREGERESERERGGREGGRARERESIPW